MAGLEAGRSSIRARIRFWIVAMSTVTMVAFTTAAILEERRRLLETEAVHAATLLAHLAHMPEFRGPRARRKHASSTGAMCRVCATGSRAVPSRSTDM